MNTTSHSPAAEGSPALADFTTDRRVLLLTLLAVPIGAIGALVAKALLWLIALFTNLAYFQRWSGLPASPADNHLGLWAILVPAVGALIIGLMARYGSEKIRGHGIPEALEAILLGKSLIDPRVAVLKPVSSALSIGTGGPFGAEGPIIMTGGAFGSLFAQRFRLTAAERKTLLVAGAAAGMSAVFATPIAAVLLAVELLLFEWKPRSFIPVAVAAVVAAVVRVPLLGAGPVFPVAPHAMLSPSALILALVVGLAAGFGSGALTALVYACEDFFAKLPIHWMWWPALGGLVVGLGGWIDPRALGVGYDNIQAIIQGHMLGLSLGLLLLVKAVIWSVSLGSGTSGGVLAPLLTFGGAIGALIGAWWGPEQAALGALVGMAGMMGGTMRSPLTGMFFVLELTHDFQALPALMVSSVVALGVTVLLLKRSILTEKLARRGQHITREYTVDVFDLALVRDVMDPKPPLAPASMTVNELAARIAGGEAPLAQRQGTVLVDESGALAGLVTRSDLMRAMQGGQAGRTTVLEVGKTDLITTHPEETLRDALEKMLANKIGRLPVVESPGSKRVVGYLGRADILAARVKLAREEQLRETGPWPFGTVSEAKK
ncbi:MAG TPA: chloride channel protein [Candidatus Didemnitutus sp.]|nr:chloride channel protein [Candidatus Didemnitutus sp.]